MTLSVASVATQRSLGEFLLLKTSLEQYHRVDWHVSTDSFACQELKRFKNIRTLELVETDECSHVISNSAMNRRFSELILTKFEALGSAIKKNGYGLFLDADIFFTNPIEDRVLGLLQNPAIDAILSPHMTNNFVNESRVGFYNVGCFAFRNIEYLKMHRTLTTHHEELGMYYEQQPLQISSYSFLTANLPIQYNLGWWRFNEPYTYRRLKLLTNDGKRLFFDGKKAVCFHVHTCQKLEYDNQGAFLKSRVVSLMKECDNPNYSVLLDIIESSRESKA